ncbi:hypothetical protein V7183_18680 [Bacillus sp. JJ1127]|uniref:hypothetical protein n=1 Tax=Bacillus sp. JJ1127 TaxID=3122952 RepID=UPI002FFEF055
MSYGNKDDNTSNLKVETIGKLNTDKLAEGLVKILRRDMLNGKIDSNNYTKPSKAENPKDKKE